MKPNTQAALTVVKSNVTQEITLTVAQRPDEQTASLSGTQQGSGRATASDWERPWLQSMRPRAASLVRIQQACSCSRWSQTARQPKTASAPAT